MACHSNDFDDDLHGSGSQHHESVQCAHAEVGFNGSDKGICEFDIDCTGQLHLGTSNTGGFEVTVTVEAVLESLADL